MRIFAFLCVLATLSGCATNLTPEQQAERQMRWSRVATHAADTALRIADGYAK